MNVGENIRKIRKEKGLTQKQLGELLGVSQAAIGQFENPNANLKLETIQKIADALDIDIATLLLDPSKSIKENLKDFPQNIQIASPLKDVKLSPKQILDANFIIEFSSKDYEFEELEAIKQFAEFIKQFRKDAPPS